MTVLYQDADKKISVFQDQKDFSQSTYYRTNNWCLCGKPEWTVGVWGSPNTPVTALVVEPLSPIRPNECWGLRLQHHWGAIRLECRDESQHGWTSPLDQMLARFPDLYTIKTIHPIARDHSVIRLIFSESEIQNRWSQILDKTRGNIYNMIAGDPVSSVSTLVDSILQFGSVEYSEALQQHVALFVLYHVGQIKKDFDRLADDLLSVLTISNIDDSVRRNQTLMNQVWRPWIEQFAHNKLMTRCQQVFGTQQPFFRELYIMEIGRRISESIEQAKQEIIDEVQLVR